ncbi:MAG TPA: M48 family metalloprotease [Gemmatimonadota bacterium]|nr:M48 family metalloprotease [Gemmatimonadota bacterium]
MRISRFRTLAMAALVAATAAPLGSCATNPATGESQLSLIGEGREIEMGRQGAQQVRQTIGIYRDSALAAYVSGVGQGLAQVSERPDLPWSYQVADEPVVNAFALPGGFIFVTRGILPYLENEAQLAIILGHESGHVTARHSVEQMSRQELAQLGLGLGSIFVKPIRQYGQLFGAGLQVLFLKYSRDDENQADALGIRYAVKDGYDPYQAIGVFQMLDRQSAAAGGSGVPSWLATHPAPADRVQNIRRQIDTLPPAERSGRVSRDAYLRHIDGMVFGSDPRDGFFRGGLFLHPNLAFRVQFPDGWKTQNMPSAVAAQSPDQDAILELTLADSAGSQDAAARAFFSSQGVQASRVSSTTIHGFPATTGLFSASTEQGQVEGEAAFIGYGGHVYRILGYTTAGSLSRYRSPFESTMGSFDRLTDSSALNVKPMRVELYTPDHATTITELARTRASPVDVQTLAIMNQMQPDDPIPAGRTIKWVAGQKPPGS